MADTVAGASPDPHVSGEDPNRRDFIHIAAGVAAVGLVGGLAWPFIDQMNPAGDTLALASIEFDLSKVVEGQQVVVKWRGKPLFVRYRTAKEIEAAIRRVEQIAGPDVVRIRYEIGEDWSGQWAIFFRIVLTDDAARRRLREVATKVVWGLSRELDFPGMGVFPYHNFRSLSEQAMLQEPAWA